MAGNERISMIDYTGTPQTVVEMFRAADGLRGQKAFKLRSTVENVIRHVRPKDYWSEVLAVYYWTCGPQFRYTRDPSKVEQIKDPVRMIEEIEQFGSTLVDCDEFATFLRAALGTIGCETRILTVGFRPSNGHEANPKLFDDPIFKLMTSSHPRLPGPFTHVFAQAEKPNRSWVTVDPVAGPRTGRMHKRVKQLRIYQESDNE